MKKIMMTLAAVLCCAMTTTVFTACGSDDDDNVNGNTPNLPDNTPAYAEVTFTFWGTQDLLDIADMTVTYNDGTGDKTETVTTVDWVKTIKAPLPVSFKFERKVTLKEGVTLSNDQTYSYVNSHQVKHKVITANGIVIKSGTAGSIGRPSISNLKGDKINFTITQGHMDASHTYDFDKDGKCPQLDSPE